MIIFQDLRKKTPNIIRTTAIRSKKLAKQPIRIASDYLGSLITKNWRGIPNKNVATVDPFMLIEVLQIYHRSFATTYNGQFTRYSKIFNHIFYVAKIETNVAGYCIYYIKPSLSLNRIRKIAVLYSIAVDRAFRGKGIGRQLMAASIQEMKLNDIDEIILYVNKNNILAMSLYSAFSFVIVEEISNICGEGENCYKMRLKL